MRTGFLTIALAIGATAGAASTTAAQTFAITNARIHTVSGSVIERGTVVIQNGRITAVGANVTVPSGVQSIDATGKVVTPGLLDSHTGLGTVEIGAAAGTERHVIRNRPHHGGVQPARQPEPVRDVDRSHAR